MFARRSSPLSHVRSGWRGFVGEKLATFGMWMWLDAKVYHRVDGLIVPTDRGTTQIDHVLVSRYGIFVIETKNMAGWIFGTEEQPEWTQVHFRQKRRFQNPLRQNYRHTRALAGFLGLEHSLFHSIAFFIGDCRFKTNVPRNVMTRGLSSYIKSFTIPVLEPARISEVAQRLGALKTESAGRSGEHVAALRCRYSSTVTCPRCSRALVTKTAKHGRSAGQSFLGCSGYPKCRYTRELG